MKWKECRLALNRILAGIKLVTCSGGWWVVGVVVVPAA